MRREGDENEGSLTLGVMYVYQSSKYLRLNAKGNFVLCVLKEIRLCGLRAGGYNIHPAPIFLFCLKSYSEL